MATYTLDDLSRLIDHTNLHPDATEADMAKLCDEAKRYHFKMVAINQVQSKFCSFRIYNFLRYFRSSVLIHLRNHVRTSQAHHGKRQKSNPQ